MYIENKIPLCSLIRFEESFLLGVFISFESQQLHEEIEVGKLPIIIILFLYRGNTIITRFNYIYIYIINDS